jgi:glycosidase
MKQIFVIGLLSLLANSVCTQIDFRKETIYFLLPSRFNDGDSTNNAPTEWCSYIPGVNNADLSNPKDVSWRGDFKGLIQKLDYIKNMGFTAVWITPIVQGRSPLDYHGYHGWDFMKVDNRLEGPGATLKDLVEALHAKEMKLVVDIVTNHSCRYGIKAISELKYNTDPNQPWGKDKYGNALVDNPSWQYDGIHANPLDSKIWSRSNLAKMPAPYNQNLAAFNFPCTESFVSTSNANYFHQDGNGFVQGWDDTLNCYNRAISDDCPDLNTGSKAVQDYFFNAYKKFIDAGVDAFRWDTWKHMNKRDIIILYDRFKAYKPDLFIFGEVAQKRFELHPVKELNPHWYTWRGDVGNSAPLDAGVLDFYGEATFHNIFENGGAFSGITDAARYDNLYSNPSLLVTWLDNHDFGPNNDWNKRYSGSAENLAACMNFMFTWRGIPSVYYGTENQFMKGAYCDIHEPASIRKSLDVTGRAYFGNEFSKAVNNKLYQHFKKLNDIRKAIPALQSGSWYWAGNYPGNGIGYVRRLGAQWVAVGLAKDGNANFSFTGLANGIYRDAVTGREVNVTNGNLSFSVKSTSAGIYVLNGPGMIGDAGSGYFDVCVTGCSNPPKMQISPVGDNYENSVTISMSSTGGSGNIKIYYTLDGSQPSGLNGILYTSPFTVKKLTVVKAIAIDAANKKSDIQGQRYTFFLSKPEVNISPVSGNYIDTITVSLSASKGKAPYTIVYTTNGQTPDSSSTRYRKPFKVWKSTTVKAACIDANKQISEVSTAQYTFNIPPPSVSAEPPGGNYYSGSVSVSLSAETPKTPATIYYTTNGSQPTTASPMYTSPVLLTGPEAKKMKYFAIDRDGRSGSVDSQYYTFNDIPDMTVYFRKPSNWNSPVKIHYWNALPTNVYSNTTWPGVNMTQVCNGSEWCSFTFKGLHSCNIVFNDGSGHQTSDLFVTQTSYYDNGWLSMSANVTMPDAVLTATPSTGQVPLSVSFSGVGSSACQQLNYFWDFGDGSTQATGINPATTHNYSTVGQYKAVLTVTDALGQSDTASQIISVSNTQTAMTLHFKRPVGWSNTPHIYYWNTTPVNLTVSWPGIPMTSEGNGWWKHTLVGANCANLIFNNSGSPRTPDLYNCGDGWYDNGWSGSSPVIVSKQPKNILTVFPNPVSQVLHIKCSNKTDKYSAVVYDIRGAVVDSFDIERTTHLLQVKRYVPGIYKLVLRNKQSIVLDVITWVKE